MALLEKSSVSTPGAHRFECPQGFATLARATPRVIQIAMSGSVDASVGKRLAAALHGELSSATRPVHTFWDLEAMFQYASEVRVLSTQALVRNWDKVASVETLATNRLVKMGVAVANVALRGRIKNTEKRSEFERKLRAALDQP
jgi:hypothetical protein